MGLGDIFKANENDQLKAKIQELESSFNNERNQLQARIAELEARITPEQLDFERLQNELMAITNKISDRNLELTVCNEKLLQINAEIKAKQNQVISLDEELTLESFGLYKPRYDFTKSEQYLIRLEEVRRLQKAMISDNTAVLANPNWTVNGSVAQGKKMVKDMQKLLLRAFNGECDDLVSRVKYNNFETSLKRINASCDAISKLGAIMQISISSSYRKAKIDELTLAFEYAQKKQQEKEAEKEARAILREEARLQKEIEEERKRLEKEQIHYQNALERLNAQLAQNPNNEELQIRQHTLIEKLEDTEKAIKDVDYREANKRAGYVYIISNVGAFGENVFKIGMTRRLNPQDRVDELGDASVPFKFDVHAMIFSDDAPALEAALHRAFEDKKVNMVNPRREFFRVTLDEIKTVIRQNFDKTVEFTDIPDAEQWRISMKMRGEKPKQSAPQADTQSACIAKNLTTEQNLAEKAIELIHTKLPTAECTYTENNGIFTILIKNRGRLRISNRGRQKCDYTNEKGKISFFENIDKVCQLI